jgi:hypothetical protein
MVYYLCDGIGFESYDLAVEYANNQYMLKGIILGIEEIK